MKPDTHKGYFEVAPGELKGIDAKKWPFCWWCLEVGHRWFHLVNSIQAGFQASPESVAFRRMGLAFPGFQMKSFVKVSQKQFYFVLWVGVFALLLTLLFVFEGLHLS